MIELKIIEYNTGDKRKAVDLRERVLRKPLGAVFLPWELEEEAKHIHIIGIIESEIVATGILVPLDKEMKMQRVVVSESINSTNYCSEMMDFMRRSYWIIIAQNCIAMRENLL